MDIMDLQLVMHGCTSGGHRMNNRHMRRCTPQWPAAICVALGLAGLGANPAVAKSHVKYIPQITIEPTVLQSDGHTPVMFTAKDGSSTLWTPDQPVARGSVIKLSTFVATGGADLAQVIVRLDNARIATLTSEPWSTNLDTSTMSVGYHMVEVWAQATGDPTQTNTKTLSFYVADPVQPQAAVAASPDIEPAHSVADTDDDTTTTTEAPAISDDVPPAFMTGKSIDGSAVVKIRSTNVQIDQQLLAHASSINLTSPVLVYFSRPAGSTAVSYAYSFMRDGQSIVAPSTPLSLKFARLRIEPRTEKQAGFRPGHVTLWVWGIDKAGQPSNPLRQDLVIIGEGSSL